MSRRAIVDRLAARLGGQLWDPNGVPVIAITITHTSDLWNPAHLVLTARQAWWLTHRLGMPAPPGMDDPDAYLPDDSSENPRPREGGEAPRPAAGGETR